MDYVMYVILKCCWYWENDMILYMDEWGYFEDSLQVGMVKLQRTLCRNLGLNPGWGVSVAEYEACIMGLQVAMAKKVKNLKVYGDSALVIYQL